ncbi:cupin domain-containing protein [Solicola sp. PLA-1-18]|uniref:cupin domain-containing protein n=1 Tax=Solicola sp. PLA-1-18 TaxID=3380532 RepID=UPI003B7D5383
MNLTRLDDAVAFDPPGHHDVRPLWLQQGTDGTAITAALSHYLPGGGAEMAPVERDTVYVVLAGHLTVDSDGQTHTLGPLDSVSLSAGTARSVENRTHLTATMLVIRSATT